MTSDILSILIPVFNEQDAISELLARVIAAPLPEGLGREIIVVDDGSTDRSPELAEAFIAGHPHVSITLIRQKRNMGKGAAIRAAILAANGRYSIIQDADLEYDPKEYPRLLKPLLEGRADVVFGSRFLVSGERRVLYYWHAIANKLLTTLCNMAADLNLTDMETCYKAFRTSLAKSIPIQSNRFGIEPELTVKFARRKARVYEVPISYYGRTYEEGKKIGAKDAFEAVWVILRSRFTKKLHTDTGPAVLDAMSAAPKFNRWMAETILPHVGDKVLEIGAGIGNMTRQICPRRSVYIATDIDQEYLDELANHFQHRPAVSVHKLDAENAEDFRRFHEKVETVICLNVLEHIRDDTGTLRRIRTVLQPGGRLILLVPNDPGAYGTLDEALGHYRRYTDDQLRAALLHTGYEVEDVLKFNRVSLPGWKVTGQVLKSRVLTVSGMRLFDRFVWLWRRIDSKLPWGPASIIAIARRAD